MHGQTQGMRCRVSLRRVMCTPSTAHQTRGTHPAIIAPVMRLASMPLTPHAAPAQPATRTRVSRQCTAMQHDTQAPSCAVVEFPAMSVPLQAE